MVRNGYAWASNKYLSELYGVTTVTISKWIRELRNLGYIDIELEYKGKQIIRRKIYLLKKTLIPIKENFNTPIKENFKDNITSSKFEKKNGNKQTKKQKTGMDYIENSNESEEVKEAFKEFIKNRIAMKSPVTEFGAKKLLNLLNRMYKTDKDKIECIEQSIMNGWKGLFPISGRKNNTPNVDNYKNKEDTPEEMEEAKKRLEKLAREQGIKT